MARVSIGHFFRLIGLPCLLYIALFFGGSEIIEHVFLNKLSESMIHILHLVRGIFSVFFVAVMVYLILSRIQRTFTNQMEAVCSLLSAANQGLLALDSSWNVVSYNTRATELLGSLHSGDFSRWVQEARTRIGKETEFETLDPSKNSRLSVIALQSLDSGYLLLVQDVTEKKRIEEQWVITEKLVSVGRMAAGLAHEIGTPLNVISGRAELIQGLQQTVCNECQSKPFCPVNKHVDVIFQQIDRISGIIHQLLTQACEPRTQKGFFPLSDTIHKAVELMQPTLEKKHIQLRLDLRRNLPPIHGFSDQFQQVLINLLMNSVDAIENKDGMIEVSTGAIDGEVLLAVRDNGVGIPEENLTRIFDPFFTTKEFGRGTGLGLTVTANIVRSHGGAVEVQSSRGQWTLFTIHLPAGKEDSPGNA